MFDSTLPHIIMVSGACLILSFNVRIYVFALDVPHCDRTRYSYVHVAASTKSALLTDPVVSFVPAIMAGEDGDDLSQRMLVYCTLSMKLDRLTVRPGVGDNCIRMSGNWTNFVTLRCMESDMAQQLGELIYSRLPTCRR